MHFVSISNVNSTVMSVLELDPPVLVILRIYKYVYTFCTIFQLLCLFGDWTNQFCGE